MSRFSFAPFERRGFDFRPFAMDHDEWDESKVKRDHGKFSRWNVSADPDAERTGHAALPDVLRPQFRHPPAELEPRHKVVRHTPDWGYSHGESTAIATAAAEMMDVAGWDKFSEWVSPPHAKEVARYDKFAQRFLAEIHADAAGSEGPLYHSFQNVRGLKFEPGAAVVVPLVASSSGAAESEGYAHRLDVKDQEGRPTMFAFETGTPMTAYAAIDKADRPLFGLWSEALVSGAFEVVRTETVKGGHMDWEKNAPRELDVIHLRPIGTFDPASGYWSYSAGLKLRRQRDGSLKDADNRYEIKRGSGGGFVATYSAGGVWKEVESRTHKTEADAVLAVTRHAGARGK